MNCIHHWLVIGRWCLMPSLACLACLVGSPRVTRSRLCEVDVALGGWDVAGLVGWCAGRPSCGVRFRDGGTAAGTARLAAAGQLWDTP